MSEILKVLNRKNIELKSEVVELGSVKELEAEANKVFKEIEIANLALARFVKEKNSLRDSSREINEAVNKMESIQKDFEAKAKDLGISAAGIEEYRLVNEAVKSAGKKIMDLEKQIK